MAFSELSPRLSDQLQLWETRDKYGVPRIQLLPLPSPLLQRFRDVGSADKVGAFEVGDGAAHVPAYRRSARCPALVEILRNKLSRGL